jgi:HEAT repeat protein
MQGTTVRVGSTLEALDALGNIGDKRAIPVLETLINDPDYEIRIRAKGALGKIKGQDVTPVPTVPYH